MPYEWTSKTPAPNANWHLCLWPHRSLSPNGFVTFIGTTAALFLLPLYAVLGSPILWALLPFLLGALLLTWYFIKRSWKDGELREDLSIKSDEMTLVRTNPNATRQSWHANPYWVKVELHDQGGPVPNYVTMKGAGRKVEIGAFLSADERVTLFHELQDRLNSLDINAH